RGNMVEAVRTIAIPFVTTSCYLTLALPEPSLLTFSRDGQDFKIVKFIKYISVFRENQTC
ncbi:MAG TPA: hypothetical protein V6D12_03350, partial [Candidatus Obscuribacterales bacterium]